MTYMMRTANPALNAKTFIGSWDRPVGRETMTLEGAVNKTAVLLVLLVIAAGWTWNQFFVSGVSSVIPLVGIGAIGGFVFALVTFFAKTWAPVTAPIYAVLEGLFLGGISALFEAKYPGIAFQAVAITLGTLFALLLAYKSGIIKASENFKLGVAAATGGIFLLYLVSFILRFFGTSISFIHEASPIGILFSLGVVIVAALNLVLDFDFIENGAASGVPKFMEWYSAFGLLVTLIWLYIEILRLLAKLRGRR